MANLLKEGAKVVKEGAEVVEQVKKPAEEALAKGADAVGEGIADVTGAEKEEYECPKCHKKVWVFKGAPKISCNHCNAPLYLDGVLMAVSG